MNARMRGLVALAVLVTLFTSSGGARQDRPFAAKEDGDLPDLAKLHPFQRVAYLSARRGAEWLCQANRPDGLFIHGYIPALNAELEGDNYVRQVRGALALARSARFTNTSRYAVRARQALLALLASTRTDPNEPGIRFTMLPSAEVNRLASAGLLVLAIHELPDPGQDLLDQAEQLCQFLLRQQQADGSFKDDSPTPENREIAEAAPTIVLFALSRAHAARPAAGKLEAVRKGLVHGRAVWQSQKQPRAAPWLACSATEAYLATKDKAFADLAFDVADWICGLQYAGDPRNPLWQGGFASWQGGKIASTLPTVESAAYAEALSNTCRAARQAADAPRFERYREASERCLQFLTTLQFTSANTRHFADSYKPQLYGAFHASHQDGTIRLDHTQLAVCAFTDYLESVAEIRAPAGRGGSR